MLKRKDEGLGDKTRAQVGVLLPISNTTRELRARRYHLQRLKVKQLPTIPSADTALIKCEDRRNTFNTFVGLQDFITLSPMNTTERYTPPRLRADQEKRTCKVTGDVSSSKL